MRVVLLLAMAVAVWALAVEEEERPEEGVPMTSLFGRLWKEKRRPALFSRPPVPLSEEPASRRASREPRMPCSGAGRVAPEEICASDACTVTAFRCDQNVIAVDNFTGDYAQCTVDTIICQGSLGGPSQAAVPANCLVAAADCRINGNLVSLERYELPSNFSSCVVRKLECPTEFFLLETAATNACSSLTCGGAAVMPSESPVAVKRANDDCVVSNAPCNDGCFEWVRICDNATDCEWRGKNCTNGCTITNDKGFCECPRDLMGASCNLPRPFECTFDLISPTPMCEAYDPLDQDTVDADPVCHRYKFADGGTETFQYRVNCSFTNLTGLVLPFIFDDGFVYPVLVDSRFAVSIGRFVGGGWIATLKAFDWKSISASDVTVSVKLDARQLAGADAIDFSVDFEKLTDSYLYGGRMYAEIGFDRIVQLAGLTATSRKARLFVDFEDLANLAAYPPAGEAPKRLLHSRGGQQAASDASTSWTLVFGSVAAGLATLALFAFMFDSASARREKEENKKKKT